MAHGQTGKGSCQVEHDPDTVNISLRKKHTQSLVHKPSNTCADRQRSRPCSLTHTLYPLRTWWEEQKKKKRSERGCDEWQKWESRYKTLLIKITSTTLIKLTGSISKGVISNPSPPFQAFHNRVCFNPTSCFRLSSLKCRFMTPICSFPCFKSL